VNTAVAHEEVPAVTAPENPFHYPVVSRSLGGRRIEVHMRPMLTVLFVGGAVSVATALSGAEAVQAYTPFTVLSTGVLLVAYWIVADEHTPAHSRGVHKKAA
jgi:hypothetical protein